MKNIQPSGSSFKVEFDYLLQGIKERLTYLYALKLFKLDPNIVYASRTGTHLFYKLYPAKSDVDKVVSDSNFINYLKDVKNLRNIVVFDDFNDANTSTYTEDIRLYKDGNTFSCILDQNIYTNSVINSFDKNKFYNGSGAGGTKGKLYKLLQKINKKEHVISYKDCDIIGFYDLFCAKSSGGASVVSISQTNNEKGTSNNKTHFPVAYNKIFYGVPGCGKSYHIEHIVLDEIFQNCNDKKDKNIFRTIFYQDYSHADFVGQYMPKRINGQVEYTFVPKVFTKALEKAYQCPDEPVVLIIEEINRGDAASIFGDIFQLLDRNSDGESEYKIDCDEIVDYLNEKRKKKAYKSSENISQIIDTGKIYLPKNLYLLATMNTCDQNVFALDTAFKRRWRMEEIPNEFNNHELKDKFVPYDFGADEYITWEDFVKVVNKQIVDCSDEFFGDDRQIGCFFVDDTCLLDDPPVKDEDKSRNFAYKVISYLWNDVAKINRTKWFKENIKTLHDVIDGFKRNDEIFNDDLKQALRNNNQQTSDSTDTGKTIGELQENEGIEE